MDIDYKIIGKRIKEERRKKGWSQEKMEKIEKPSFTSKPHFSFKGIETTAQVILEVKDLEVGYYYSLLPKMKFEIKNQEKIVIVRV